MVEAARGDWLRQMRKETRKGKTGVIVKDIVGMGKVGLIRMCVKFLCLFGERWSRIRFYVWPAFPLATKSQR